MPVESETKECKNVLKIYSNPLGAGVVGCNVSEISRVLFVELGKQIQLDESWDSNGGDW